jgi:hypothetical protein
MMLREASLRMTIFFCRLLLLRMMFSEEFKQRVALADVEAGTLAVGRATWKVATEWVISTGCGNSQRNTGVSPLRGGR